MHPSAPFRQNKQMQCDICLRIRPMDLVDDLVVDVSEAVDFGPSYVGTVVSFCLDCDECRAKAQQRIERLREWLKVRHKANPFSKA